MVECPAPLVHEPRELLDYSGVVQRVVPRLGQVFEEAPFDGRELERVRHEGEPSVFAANVDKAVLPLFPLT